MGKEVSPPKYPVPVHLLLATPKGEKGESGCAAKPLREGAAMRRVPFFFPPPQELRRHLGSPPTTPLAAPALPPSFLPGGGKISQGHPDHQGGGHIHPTTTIRESPATNCLLRSGRPSSGGRIPDRGSPQRASSEGAPGRPMPRGGGGEKASGKEGRKKAAPTYICATLGAPAEPGGRDPPPPAIPFVLPRPSIRPSPPLRALPANSSGSKPLSASIPHSTK